MLPPEARTRRALFVTKAGQCKKETGLAVLVGRRAGLTVLGFEDFSGDLGLEFCMAGSRVFREIWVANSAWCRGSVLAWGCGEWGLRGVWVLWAG